MKPVYLNKTKITNWKDYLELKFMVDPTFKVELIDEDDKFLESYRITIANNSSDTEIIFRTHIDGIKYVELFDVHFNHPKSPELSKDNRNNDYGFDGQGSTFCQKHVNQIEDWLAIPIKYGWVERTIYFKNKRIKTECVWIQDGKTVTIPIKQDYLDKYGCLMFPIIPLKIYLTDRTLKRRKDEVRTEEAKVEPMEIENR